MESWRWKDVDRFDAYGETAIAENKRLLDPLTGKTHHSQHFIQAVQFRAMSVHPADLV